MRIGTWQAIVGLTAVTCALTLAQVPRASWFTTATLSLSLGASAFVLVGAAALLGGRLKTVDRALMRGTGIPRKQLRYEYFEFR